MYDRTGMAMGEGSRSPDIGATKAAYLEDAVKSLRCNINR